MISYTIISNPTNEKYWKRIYDLITTTESWSNNLNDYKIWREGFGEENFRMFFAINDERDEAIGVSCSTNYYRILDESKFLTVSGMLFVDPKYRGQKIGTALMNKFSIGFQNRCLISEPFMSEKYAKSYGYNKIPEDNMRDLEIKIDKINLSPLLLSSLNGVTIGSANESDWPKIFEFDRKMLKYNIQRDKFIQLFCTQPNSYFKIAVNSSNNNNVVGICLLRCNHKIKAIFTGPFYADTLEIAENLFVNTFKAVPDLSNFEEIRFAFYKTSPTLKMLKKFVKEEDLTNSHKQFIQFTTEIISLPTLMLYSVAETDSCFI